MGLIGVAAGDHLGQCLRIAHISAAAFCLSPKPHPDAKCLTLLSYNSISHVISGFPNLLNIKADDVLAKDRSILNDWAGVKVKEAPHVIEASCRSILRKKKAVAMFE